MSTKLKITLGIALMYALMVGLAMATCHPILK